MTNQIIFAAAGAAASAVLAPVIVPLVAAPVGLGALGASKSPFHVTQAEVATNLLKPLGGLASVMQSGIGSVAVGSWFAVTKPRA